VVEFDREIRPGGTGKVLVKLNSEKVRGQNLTKTVKIQSNDTANPDYPLSLTGDILQVLTAEPAVANLRGLAGSTLTGSVTLKKGAWLDISEVISVEPKQRQVRVVNTETLVPGSDFRLDLVADPNEIPGMVRDEIIVRVRASDGVERELSVPAMIEHNPRIVVDPRGNVKFLANQIQTLRFPGAAPVSRPILLRTGGEGVTFHVLDVRLDEKLQGVFRTEIVPVTEGSVYRVLVHLDAWHEVPQVLGRMTIVTDDPDQAEISMWVMAHFGKDVPVAPPAGAKPGVIGEKPGEGGGTKPVEPGHEGHGHDGADHPGG
jgi:hypothetical protein